MSPRNINFLFYLEPLGGQSLKNRSLVEIVQLGCSTDWYCRVPVSKLQYLPYHPPSSRSIQIQIQLQFKYKYNYIFNTNTNPAQIQILMHFQIQIQLQFKYQSKCIFKHRKMYNCIMYNAIKNVQMNEKKILLLYRYHVHYACLKRAIIQCKCKFVFIQTQNWRTTCHFTCTVGFVFEIIAYHSKTQNFKY